jgi:RimJ/RimL family protein N-acetyltransferase
MTPRTGMPVLETGRLTLAPFTRAHARDVENFARLWEVARHTSSIPHPYPQGGALDFAFDTEQERRNGSGGLVFAVSLKGDATTIGLIDVRPTDDEAEAELGYAFSPLVWGRGVASEAARAVVGWGFDGLDLTVVVSRALVINPASCRVLQKTGFRRIGNSTIFMPARDRDGLFEDYRLPRREWHG